MIETLDDIVEEIANHLDIYGAHSQSCEGSYPPCRCCFTANLTRRIKEAVKLEDERSLETRIEALERKLMLQGDFLNKPFPAIKQISPDRPVRPGQPYHTGRRRSDIPDRPR